MRIGMGVSLSDVPSGLGAIGSVTGENALTSGRPSDWNANATTVSASFVEATATPVDAVYADVVDNSGSFAGKWHDAVAVGAGEIWEAHCLVDYAGTPPAVCAPIYISDAGLSTVLATVVQTTSLLEVAVIGGGINPSFHSLGSSAKNISEDIFKYSLRFLCTEAESAYVGLLPAYAGLGTLRCGGYSFFRVQ